MLSKLSTLQNTQNSEKLRKEEQDQRVTKHQCCFIVHVSYYQCIIFHEL